MNLALATIPGDPEHPNEDWLGACLPASGSGGALVALDGVTPPRSGTGCSHGVPWFVARLGGRLVELSASRRDLTLGEILSDSISDTADSHRQTCDLSHVRTPQATVVLARWDRSRVEYLVLSDSVLLLRTPAGGVRAVRDDSLDRLPPGVRSSVAATDALRNADGGFFTAAADPAVSERAVTGEVPRAEVQALAALTDGASRWRDAFAAGDWVDCMDVLRTEGPQGLLARVRELERAEPCGRTRRGKVHDDATAAYAEL
ncbi:hypothetical protein [Streptomyces sp. NPDC006879]|uniref:hypothetical protein n=1 Tax=Streptomyces sp. NPDC006879 TaxID=3364767 RepID=UPI0036AEC7CC